VPSVPAIDDGPLHYPVPGPPRSRRNFSRQNRTSRKILSAPKVTSKKYHGPLNSGRAGFFFAGSCAGKKIFSGLIRPRAKNRPAPGLGYQGRLRRRASPGRPWICLREFWYNGACCEPGCTSFPQTPQKREVIIRKNAEQGPEFTKVCRRE